MFIDSVKIYVKAGKGAMESLPSSRKYVPKGGPAGGNGGRWECYLCW